MIDGSGSFDCRIFGKLRPVRMFRKRGAISHQSAPRTGRQIVLDIGLETDGPQSIAASNKQLRDLDLGELLDNG